MKEKQGKSRMRVFKTSSGVSLKLHGTTECKELLGADMSTVEGLKRFRRKNW